MLSFLRILLATMIGVSANAATHNSDGTPSNVQTLHDSSASDGDTITIPDGTHTWSSGVTITKRITITGLGTVTLDGDGRAFTCGTKIEDSYNAGNLITVTVPSFSGLAFHCQNIQFQPGSDTTGVGAAISMVGRLDSRRIRVSYCVATNLSSDAFFPESVYGVIDHCRVRANHQRPVDYVKNQLAAGSGANTHGIEVWQANDDWGTDKFLFYEDCNLGTDLPAWHLTISDGSWGCRRVFRHCTIVKGGIENHGAEAEWDPGHRMGEIYNCDFVGDDNGGIVLFSRSGTWLVHNNTVTDYGATPVLSLLEDRVRDQLCYPFGGADGRNPWDINDASNPFDTGTVTTGTATEVANVSKSIIASGESYTTDQYVGYALRVTSGTAITSATRSGSVGTVRAPGNTFAVGDKVSIFGADQYAWNYLFTVVTIDAPTADDFTISLPYPVTTPATGTLKCRSGGNFAMIMAINAGTQKITYNDSLFFGFSPIGGWVMNLSAGDTYEINKVTQAFDMIGTGKHDNVLTGDLPAVPGGGHTQASNPSYEWNNTGEAGYNVQFSKSGVYGDNPVIVENTHFFNDTSKPGHTDYQYPHELVSGDIQGRGRSHKLKNIRLK